jgi:hypothetical protein
MKSKCAYIGIIVLSPALFLLGTSCASAGNFETSGMKRYDSATSAFYRKMTTLTR